MPSYYFFDEFMTDLSFEIKYERQHRSIHSLKKVKNCIEMTMKTADVNTPIIGFTNIRNQRTFLAYVNFNVDKNIRYTKNYAVIGDFDCTIKQNVDETVQVCFDSETNEFTVIKGSEKCTAIVELEDTKEYYAYLDHANTVSADIGSVTINTGANQFVNEMPSGYSSWNDSVLKYYKKRTVSVERHSLPQCFLFVMLHCFV